MSTCQPKTSARPAAEQARVPATAHAFLSLVRQLTSMHPWALAAIQRRGKDRAPALEHLDELIVTAALAAEREGRSGDPAVVRFLKAATERFIAATTATGKQQLLGDSDEIRMRHAAAALGVAWIAGFEHLEVPRERCLTIAAAAELDRCDEDTVRASIRDGRLNHSGHDDRPVDADELRWWTANGGLSQRRRRDRKKDNRRASTD